MLLAARPALYLPTPARSTAHLSGRFLSATMSPTSPRKEQLMYPGCEECSELWRQYALVTVIHVQLDNKLRLAALQNGLDLIETFTREAEGAERVRLEL